jgi:hypothetical protein
MSVKDFGAGMLLSSFVIASQTSSAAVLMYYKQTSGQSAGMRNRGSAVAQDYLRVRDLSTSNLEIRNSAT